MNHDDALMRLDEYFDGELPPALAADVDSHVRACSHCQAALDRRAALSRSFSGMPVQPPSERFVQSVLSAVSAERSEPAPGWARWVLPSLTAGLAAAAVMIGIGFTAMRDEAVVTGNDPLARLEQESEASLAGLEPSRTEDADSAMLLAMED